MSISENYIPQSENLEHFNQIVDELQLITNQNSRIKNSIVTKIDLLIKQLNKDGKSGQNNDVIKTLNHFISGFSNVYDDDEGETDIENVDEEKAILLKQNQRLRSILQSQIEYNSQIEQLNTEYHEQIGLIMKQIHDRKHQLDLSKIQQYKEIQSSLTKLKQQEFSRYMEYIQNQEILHKLGRTVIDIFKIMESNHDEESELNQLLNTLDLYQSAQKANGGERQKKYTIDKFKKARIFQPLQGRNPVKSPKFVSNQFNSSSSSLNNTEWPSFGG